jgi:hypothetical protein
VTSYQNQKSAQSHNVISPRRHERLREHLQKREADKPALLSAQRKAEEAAALSAQKAAQKEVKGSGHAAGKNRNKPLPSSE